MLISTIIFGIILIILILLSVQQFRKLIQSKKDYDELIKDLNSLQSKENEFKKIIETSQQLNERLNHQNDVLREEISASTSSLEQLNKTYNQQKNHIDNLINNSKDVANSAFEVWCDQLDKNYSEKEKEYNKCLATLIKSYEQKQDLLYKSYENTSTELTEKIKCYQDELKSIEQTRLATIEAQKKEQEVKEKRSFYCITISDAEAADIRVLERIKPELKMPRILSMLIWSTYYQKPMTTLCNNILGINTVCGIYKITNQSNGYCYIGQAVDVAKRWKDHAKCGLGIDTPASNKLYKAMQEDGLCNFSFELLEKCSKEELDEKERYYINLYKSKEYGYNTLAGNGKNR